MSQISWAHSGPAIAAAFLSSLVEFVEALTIVLAAGVTRGWRSSLIGTGAAVSVLAVLTLVLGPAVEGVALESFQLVVGILLLLFGMRWARKAILRSAGALELHDEAEAFRKEERTLESITRGTGTIDWVGFSTAFQGVFVEGVEVVFIVVAIGGADHNLAAASLGAAAAALLVALVGVLLHRPLTQVPENTLKYLVAIMLSTFGTFWVGEGLRLEWPGGDWALIGLLVAYFVTFGIAVQWAKYLTVKPGNRPMVPGGSR
jgi:Ca2+/H+ antiporter, TMEM165/GDT1 family